MTPKLPSVGILFLVAANAAPAQITLDVIAATELHVNAKKIAKNTKLVLVPKLKVKGKAVALDDDATLINAGAFYLKKGDKVVVRLGANKKSNLWEAEYIERK